MAVRESSRAARLFPAQHSAAAHKSHVRRSPAAGGKSEKKEAG